MSSYKRSTNSKHNARMQAIWEKAHKLERERLERGEPPNPSLTSPEEARKYGWEIKGREVSRIVTRKQYYLQRRFEKAREAIKLLTGGEQLPFELRLIWERDFYLQELKTARIRLEILQGRIQACHEKHPEEHEVSIEELPAWIQEMREEEVD